MKTKKYTNNLQKSSGLFLQLGLVLTLFTVYLALELKTEKRTAFQKEILFEPNEPYELENIKDFVVEPTAEVKKVKSITKIVKSTNIVISETPTSKDKPPFEPTDPDDQNPTTAVVSTRPPIVDVLIPEEFEETIRTIDEVPVYPGCEKAKYKDKKACFENKLRKFVGRKFNTSLAPQLGLTSGGKRIFIEFIITKTGEITITNARAPHKKLKEEGMRVVKKLPKMIPGKKAGKNVNMKYMLPINFEVQ